MRIALCDDEAVQQKEYGALLEGFAQKHGVALKLDCYSSGEQLLFHLEDNNLADIVFLDVNMPALDGLETARRMRQAGYIGEIVFLTVSKEHVFDAFDVGALHYIVKGMTPTRKIEEIFCRAVSETEEKQSEYLLLSAVGEYRNVPLRKIRYFEIMQRLITVHYGNGEQFEFVSTIGKLEAQLCGKGFVRVSRSFLAALEHIVSFSYDNVVLTDGKTLPVGRKYYKALKEAVSAQTDG